MKLCTHITVLVMLATMGHGAEIGPHYCGVEYLELIDKAIETKQECESAAFYDCCQAKTLAPVLRSDIYELTSPCVDGPFDISKVKACCDMETDGGGWIVIQRRTADNRVNFTRNWEDYKVGFGDLESEYWLGLDNIHCLTVRDELELRIDLKTEDGDAITWVYQHFFVDGPVHSYRLHIGEAEGTEGCTDSMAYHNGRQFSTYDEDNDMSYTLNCAQEFQGGWWYKNCYHTNLNGPHDPIADPPLDPRATQIMWYYQNSDELVYYPYVEMKVRPKTCHTKCDE